jgi:hypothetical protein
MEDEITIEHEGIQYSASYTVSGDTLTVFLPNGEPRTTELRDLDPERAARVHLRAYVGSVNRKKN